MYYVNYNNILKIMCKLFMKVQFSYKVWNNLCPLFSKTIIIYIGWASSFKIILKYQNQSKQQI